MALVLTCAVVTRSGDHALAYRAADRGVQAAERSGDPVVTAAAARHLADAVFHCGEGEAAIAPAAAVAQRLEADLVARGPHGLSTLGMLRLKAAVAAARIDARTPVPDLLAAAQASAARLGADGNALWTAFGPTNVRCRPRAAGREGSSRPAAARGGHGGGPVAHPGRSVWTTPVTDTRVLYLLACAAPPAQHLRTGTTLAQQAGWDVCLILSPTAYTWQSNRDLAELETLTHHPIRYTYKRPGTADVLPPPDAMLVAPATFNTINKWAAGIADTLLLGLATEAIGLHLPVVALPCLNAAQAAHPALSTSVALLRSTGISVLLGDDGFTPHLTQDGDVDHYPWNAAVNALPHRTAENDTEPQE
jgi:Flavoprotein